MNNYDYIIDAFTQDGNNVNEEIDNLTVGCITSKNNTFDLDSQGNLTVRSITETNGNNRINLLDVYPVGSIYLSVSNADPSSLFGGTWARIQDKFLLAAGSTYAAGATGGTSTETLTINQIPSHGHSFSATTGGSGSHSHTGHTKEHRIPTNGNWQGTSDYARPLSSSYDYAGITITDGVGNHTHSVSGNTGSNGSGQAHNNMPPYLAVYIWKRTA